MRFRVPAIERRDFLYHTDRFGRKFETKEACMAFFDMLPIE